MKQLFFLCIASLAVITVSKAQTTAMDFTMNDCSGQMHNLFAELEQNNVVILEFFMVNCSPCISAGNKLKALHTTLENQFPGHVKSYALGYTNSYTCTQVNNWVTSNNFTSTPFDSGAAQVAYYGGFGMPTIAVVAGSNHEVLFSNVGFSTSDTTAIGTAVRNYFTNNPLGVAENENNSTLILYPNPAQDNFTVQVNLPKPSDVNIQVYSLTGQSVYSITESAENAGLFSSTINSSMLSQGVYVIKVSANGTSDYKKITVLK